MINRVVLRGVEQRNEIMRFGNEHAIRLEHLNDAIDDGMNILDVCKAIGGRHNAGGSVLAFHCARRIQIEVTLDCRDAALVGDVADVRRFNAEHALTAGLEV